MRGRGADGDPLLTHAATLPQPCKGRPWHGAGTRGGPTVARAPPSGAREPLPERYALTCHARVPTACRICDGGAARTLECNPVVRRWPAARRRRPNAPTQPILPP